MRGVPTVEQLNQLGKFQNDATMPDVFGDLLVQVTKTVKALHATPAKKASLGSLISLADSVKYYFSQMGNICPTSSGARSILDNYLADITKILDFFRGLARLNTPVGQAQVRRAMGHRFQACPGGVFLVNYHPSMLVEKLDPLHRNHLVQNWLYTQIKEGKDPAVEIVDYLLSGSEAKSAYLSPADRSASEIKIIGNCLYAYYSVSSYGNKNRSWQMFLTDPARDCLSVCRDRYTSEGTDGLRRDDFVKGDTYVLSEDDKLYAWGRRTMHSTFTGGRPLKSGGILVSIDGKVHAIDNRSGHFRPNCHNLLQVVRLLEEKGVFAKEAIVGLVATGMSATMFFTVADYIALGQNGFQPGAISKVVAQYRLQYSDKIPVPASKLEFIPPGQQKSWSSASWDFFLTNFSNAFEGGVNKVIIGAHRAAKTNEPASAVATAGRTQPRDPNAN